jgi:hypothetical protein
MAIDTTQPRSRRTLLAAAVGGAAAAAAASVARVGPAGAATGDPMKVGEAHTATSQTTITNTILGGTAFRALATGSGDALVGATDAGTGVFGQSESGVGVVAVQGGNAGRALRAQGRIQVLAVSGVATIQAGRKARTVSLPVDVNALTFVLLTPMANIGSRALWFTKKAAANQIAIRMSPARGAATKVAWLALERG